MHPLRVALSAVVLVGFAAAQDRPNLLFIMADDHAAQAISAYGSQINRTPNIDRLATEGMRFERCFCTNSICSPSRAVMLTGQYSHQNGVRDNLTTFDAARVTFPELLRRAGYRTSLVGKWHLKSVPTGFDDWIVLPGQGDYHDPLMVEAGQEKRYPGYVTDIITDLAISWLEERPTDRPFCLLVHHKAPHADWESDPRHELLFADRDVPEPPTFDDDHRGRSTAVRDHRLHVGRKQWELHYENRFGPIPDDVPGDEVRSWVYQRYIKDYLRCIASVDDNVGRLLDHLDSTGLSKNTVVVYTSDQGFFLGEHGLYDKRFMYEPSLRMPLLVRYPAEIAAGSTSRAIALNLDFAPTLLDFAGVEVPGDMQGRSLRPLLRGRLPEDWREAMYYRFYEEGYGVGPMEGIRTGRHKLIHYLYADRGWELYDLHEDPREMHNLHGDPAHAELLEELTEQMADLKRQFGVTDTD